MTTRSSASIRLARTDDYEGVYACVTAAYEPYIKRIGRLPAPMLDDYAALIAQAKVHIACDLVKILGVLVSQTEEDALLIENVAVHPLYQGQGLGHMLMTFAEQEASARHSKRLCLYTNEAMWENLAFYGNLGFREVERRVENGYRRVFMQKLLR